MDGIIQNRMAPLYQIQIEIQQRTEATAASAPMEWPCRKGCDDCCRHLAQEPRVSREEWLLIEAAIAALPETVAEAARLRIRASSGSRTCPLLDTGSGSCLIYEARPLACREYGFYADRSEVLGCSRIEALAEQDPEIVWGNHAALEDRMRELGPAREISGWLREATE